MNIYFGDICIPWVVDKESMKRVILIVNKRPFVVPLTLVI